MMFALVKWLTGKEKDTHTVIDATWIRDVDVKQYDNKEGICWCGVAKLCIGRTLPHRP